MRRWQDSLLGESKGGGEREKGVEDVKWKGKGEEREWDVGKVIVREEGVKGEVEVVELEAAWSGKGKGKGGGLAGEMRRALG